MKSLIVPFLMALAVSVHGQGTVVFSNNQATAVTNSLTGQRITSTTPIWIGLFYTTDTSAVANPRDDNWTLDDPPVRPTQFPGIFYGGTRSLEGTTFLQTVLLQVRIWDTAFAGDRAGYTACVSSGDSSKLFGFSDVMRITLGGEYVPTPSLVAQGELQPIIVGVVPEPSVWALGLTLSVAAGLFMRSARGRR